MVKIKNMSYTAQLDSGALINHLQKKGKKNIPEKLYLKSLKKLSDAEVRSLFLKITPVLDLKPKKRRGQSIKIPSYLTEKKFNYLISKWLQAAILSHKGKSIDNSYNQELSSLKKNQGLSIKKRDEHIKLILANIGNVNL